MLAKPETLVMAVSRWPVLLASAGVVAGRERFALRQFGISAGFAQLSIWLSPQRL